MTGGTARGSVLAWSPEEGWGVIETEATPGGCWAHFSSLDVDGYRTLHVGQEVSVDYEPAMQDGYEWRALRVTLDGAQGQPERSPEAGHAYRSTLGVEWDDGDVQVPLQTSSGVALCSAHLPRSCPQHAAGLAHRTSAQAGARTTRRQHVPGPTVR